VAAVGVELVTVPFAHAGHWFAGLAYAAPVLVLVGWMGVVKVKDARARRRGEAPRRPAGDGPADAGPGGDLA
jgi:hypothetical protein